MPFDVFISHSLKDKTTAEAVCAKLEAEKVRCWIAPRDISPGADWAESIISALESCRVMVLIFSSHSNISPQVKREVQAAFEQGLTVMPFRIEDVQPSAGLKYYIGPVHWLDALNEPMERHIERLASLVNAFIEAANQTGETAGHRDAEAPMVADETSHDIKEQTPAPVIAHHTEAQTTREKQADEIQSGDTTEQFQQEIYSAGDAVKKPPAKHAKGLLIFVLALLIAGGTAAGWWFGIEQPRRAASAARKQNELDAAARKQADLDATAAKQRQLDAESQKERELGVAQYLAEQKNLKCLSNAKQICLACRLCCNDYDGKFPNKLEDLLPNYLTNADIFVSPLSKSKEPIGYEYFGAGLTDSADPSTVVLRSKDTTPDGRRIIVHLDDSGSIQADK